MLKQLRRWTGGYLLRQLQRDLAALRVEVGRIAAALELRNAHDYPQVLQPNPDLPPVTVAFVDQVEQAEWMDIELRLTQALGHPPTEEAVFEEWQRLQQQGRQ